MKLGNPIKLQTQDDKFPSNAQIIKEGDLILILGLTGLYSEAIVRRDEFLAGFDGEFYAEDDHNYYDLRFCDEQGCWVSSFGMNKECLEKINFKVELSPIRP